MMKKSLNELTREERSLLLYLEGRVVDNSGSLDMNHVDFLDRKILEFWAKNGFIEYGRIAYKDAMRIHAAEWCRLSPEAWALAHEERRARAERVWKKRSWSTTKEIKS